MTKGKGRCAWGLTDPMLSYHDEEWGVPLSDDRLIFEFLTLEAFQAGLSWLIVLRKRDNFRQAFAKFDYQRVAKFTARDVARLLKDAGIIRNQAKIEATISNARRFMEVRKEFGTFSKYMWSWVGGKPMSRRLKSLKDVPVTTDEAIAWAKDLKARGFRFLGPTVVYAHMQATGMVNDHTVSCFRYAELSRGRR